MTRLKNILLARDLSTSSDRALRYALDLARQSGATLHIVHAVPAPGHPDNVPPEAEIPDNVYLQRLRDSVERRHGYMAALVDVTYEIARGLEVAPTIATHARSIAADLIVTGTRARSGLLRLFGRSVAAWITRLAPCPVSVVNPSVEITPTRHSSFELAWGSGFGASVAG